MEEYQGQNGKGILMLQGESGGGASDELGNRHEDESEKASLS